MGTINKTLPSFWILKNRSNKTIGEDRQRIIKIRVQRGETTKDKETLAIKIKMKTMKY